MEARGRKGNFQPTTTITIHHSQLSSTTRKITYSKATKGCLKKSVTCSKFKSAIPQETNVLGGCPSYSLYYTHEKDNLLIHLVLEK